MAGLSYRNLDLVLICAAVFLAPINVARFPGIYFTFSDCLVFLCVLLALLNRPVPPNLFGWASPVYNAGLILMLGGLLASSLLAGDPVRGLIVFLQYLVAYMIVPLALLNRPLEQIGMLVTTFVASIATMALHGIYLIHIEGEMNTTFVSGSGRLRGFVERSNEAAALMGMTLPLLLWLAHTGRMPTWLALPLLLLIFYAILLTGSNTGTLTSVLGITFFLAMTLSIPRVIGAFAGASAFVAAMLTVGRDYLPAVFRERVLSAVESGAIGEAGTFEGRMALAKEAFDATAQVWLLGLGADQYRAWSPHGAPVHNTYLLIWTEGGFLAVLGWCAMLFALLLSAAFGGKGPMRRPDVVCGLAVLVPFMLLINGTPHVYGRFWVFPIFLALGIVLAGRRSPVLTTAPPRGTRIAGARN